MRSSIACVAFALSCVSAPALADEAYVEAVGGVSFAHEEDAVVAGLAAGYDFDLNEVLFAGVEGTLEKELVEDRHFAAGIGVRVGASVTERGKAFVGLNWQSKDCPECDEAWGFTTGFEQELGEHLYAKLEYKHLILAEEPNKNIVIGGIGYMF